MDFMAEKNKLTDEQEYIQHLEMKDREIGQIRALEVEAARLRALAQEQGHQLDDIQKEISEIKDWVTSSKPDKKYRED